MFILLSISKEMKTRPVFGVPNLRREDTGGANGQENSTHLGQTMSGALGVPLAVFLSA